MNRPRFPLASAFLRFLGHGQRSEHLRVVSAVDSTRVRYGSIPSIFAEPPRPRQERLEPLEEPTILQWGRR